MKVGTDAMVLGSLACQDNPKHILDIGSGCGILALMMAQKYPSSEILAIDIHADSIVEASQNFKESPFENLKALKTSLQELEINDHFDLIISNPPFFDDDLKSKSDNRNYARHNDNLSFDQLIGNIAKCLSDNGSAWFILPYRYDNEILSLLEKSKLFLREKIELFNDQKKEPVRIIYSVSKLPTSTLTKRIPIRIDGNYSEEYKTLTKDFHGKTI